MTIENFINNPLNEIEKIIGMFLFVIIEILNKINLYF